MSDNQDACGECAFTRGEIVEERVQEVMGRHLRELEDEDREPLLDLKQCAREDGLSFRTIMDSKVCAYMIFNGLCSVWKYEPRSSIAIAVKSNT